MTLNQSVYGAVLNIVYPAIHSHIYDSVCYYDMGSADSAFGGVYNSIYAAVYLSIDIMLCTYDP
jgi:hypothetical protein